MKELLHAIQAGNADRVLTLLRNGADPDALTDRGAPVLHVAISSKNKKIVRMLLHAGADPDVLSYGLTPVHQAAILNDSDIVCLLIAYGADIERRTPEGLTPLMIAAAYGCNFAIGALLSLQADVSAVDSCGDTAAVHARNRSHEESARLIGDWSTYYCLPCLYEWADGNQQNVPKLVNDVCPVCGAQGTS